MGISRGFLLGCSEKQSVGRLKIYPNSNLFKENVLDKLIQLKLLKFTEGTEICLGNIPMNLFFDVKSASTNCCSKCGNNIINGADKLAENQASRDNQDVICNFEPQISKVINLFPFFCEEAFHSTDFTLPYHEKITYICSNETQCNIQSSNQVKQINLETYSDSMRVENQFASRNISTNMKLRHLNSVTTFSESLSNTLKTKSGIDRANIQNESLIEFDNFVKVNQTELPNSGTLLMQLEYPRSFLVYSLMNQQNRMLKRPKCSLETDDKLNRNITNVNCKCKEKQIPCSCLHQKDKTNNAKKLRSSGGGRTCGCLHLDRIFSSDKTIVRKLSEDHELRGTRTNICGETVLRKHDFSDETTKIKTSSPMRIDLRSMWNQGKQSLTKSEDTVAEKPQWKEKCAEMRKTKRKCGCSRPYETGTALPFSAPPTSAQKKRPCKISDELICPLGKPKTRECKGKLNVKQANCRINVNNLKDRHLCDVCKLFYGIGDIMDKKESLISIEFSDVDKLISILDDVKKTGSKISTSIKRLTEKDRNAEPNDFDEYLLTCSTEGANKPNTIGLKIKYSDYQCEDQSRHVKSDSCSCLRGNLNETDTRKDIKCIFQKVSPCATSRMHDPERSNGAQCVCASKKIYECARSRDQEVDSKKSKVPKDCRSSPDRRICQGQVMPLIEVEFQANGDVKDKVECIFKNKRTCSYSSKSESASTTNIEIRNALKMQEQVLPKSCYKDSCPKLTEPLIFPEKQDCPVEESCIREKLLRTICVIPEFSAAEYAEPLKPTTQKKGSQKKASPKTEKKEISKTSKKKADSPKLTPGKPLPKKNSKKASSTAPNKVPSKQKNPKEKVSSPSVNKASTPKKKSKQKTSVSDTTVPAPKAKSKQKTSRSDTKVPTPKTNSKQTKSLSDSKIPERKTNSKKSKSSTDTKVTARKTNSKQTSSVNATKTPAGKTNSKKGSSSSATKKPAGKTKSKEKASIDTDQKPSSKSKSAKVPKKQTKTRRESSVSKKPDVTPELPVLKLNELLDIVRTESMRNMAQRFRSFSCGANGHIHGLKSEVENYYCQRTRSLMNVRDRCAHFRCGFVNNRLKNSELTKFCLYRGCMQYPSISTCHPCPRQYHKPACFLRRYGYYNKHFRCCLPGVINKPRNYCIIPRNRKVSKIQVHTGSYEINDHSKKTKTIRDTEKRNKESKKNGDTLPGPTKAEQMMNDDTNTEKRPLDGQGDDEFKGKSIKKKRKKTKNKKKKKKRKKINQLTDIDGDLISNASVSIQTESKSCCLKEKRCCCCQQEIRCSYCQQEKSCCSCQQEKRCCCCQREKRCCCCQREKRCCCCQRENRCCCCQREKRCCCCQREKRCCCCQREKRCCCCQRTPIASSCRKLVDNSTFPCKCVYHKAQHRSRYENFLIWRRKRICSSQSQCLFISQK